MTIKDSVLKTLKNNKNVYISGEDLSSTLGVSRAAVCKAVKALREEGYIINAVTNKGYLMPDSDVALSEESVRRYLPPKLRSNPLFVYDVVDSTNLQAKRLLLEQPVKHGSAVIASQQTAGRGRLGRSFYSPENGIYVSIIVKPAFDLSKAGLVTVAAAAATSEAIESVCGLATKIKWVNDIYLGNRKICGILTEATTDFESGQIDSLIIGIGINTSSQGFPAELEAVAGAISDTALNGSVKAELTASVIQNVLKYADLNSFDTTSAPDFIDSYRKRCMLTGRNITVYKGAYRRDPSKELGGISARAVGIDDSGGLIVEYEKGIRETLTTGEVSIRL